MAQIAIHAAAVAFIVAAAAVTPARAASHQHAFCANPDHASPVKVPADLVTSVAEAFEIDEATARNGAFVRCAGDKLLACFVGANLNCFKADTRRTLPGATTWCRDNPGSPSIPMSATGHATIYEWSCNGRRAVAGKVVMAVDAQGYAARNWKEIR
jgi:hypothetical protein